MPNSERQARPNIMRAGAMKRQQNLLNMDFRANTSIE